MNERIPNVTGLAKHFTPETLRAHLLSRAVRHPSGCLIYVGFGPNRRIYQKMTVRAWAHIAAYAVFVGPIDPALTVDHSCNTPPCIDPAHLRQMTQVQNLARQRGKKGHTNRPPNGTTTDHPGHVPNACAECNRRYQRAYRRREKAE